MNKGYIERIAQKSGKTYDQVFETWTRAKKIIAKDYNGPEEAYWPKVMALFKQLEKVK